MGGFGINLNTTGLGLGAGIDVQQTVSQLVSAAQANEQVYLQEQQLYTNQTSALNNIDTLLTTLQTSVNALQDPAGQLAARVVTSSNSSVVTASAAAGTTTGDHNITVGNLATTATLTSAAQASDSTTFAADGQLTFQVGSSSNTITIDDTNNTLSSLAAYINSNSQTLGVTANIVTDANGATLALVSNTSGQAGNLTITSDTTGLNFTQAVQGVNASLSVDGVSISSASNTVTGAISGLTLNLVGTSTSPVTISVATDTTQATAAINSFVSAYNAVVQAINAQFTYTSGTTQQAPLFADGSLEQVQSTLANDINYVISGNNGITSLSAIGVNLQQDGTLSVDSATLSAALSNNASSVQTFFQQSGSPSGFAINFANDLGTLTDPTRGPLYLELQGISAEQQSVQQSIDDFNNNLQQQQQAWLQEFSQVNATLQTLPLLIQQIQGQLSSLGSSPAPIA